MQAPVRTIVVAALSVGLAGAARIDVSERDLVLSSDEAPRPLCDESIVEETCRGAFGKESASGKVGVDDVKQLLSATQSSVQQVWEAAVGESRAEVSCMELCQGIVRALPAKPPTSDVGCYRTGRKIRCNVDLRPGVVNRRASNGKKDLPDFHSADKIATIEKGMAMVQARNRSVVSAAHRGGAEALEIDYNPLALMRRIANLFRIFPPPASTAGEPLDTDGNETAALLEGTADIEAEEDEEGSSAWKTKIQKVNVKAIEYISFALQQFQRRQTKKHMTKWFGSSAFSSPTSRRKVLKILNSVSDMLDNVEYVMGPDCEDDTYAYVFPEGDEGCSQSEVEEGGCAKNKKGQFIFYMCELAIKAELSVQIETLTHEGSHHATAYTDDVKFQGDTAYGREACEELAKEKPSDALKNADNFCYYIQDIGDEE